MTLPLFDPGPLAPYLTERDGLALVKEIADIFADDLPRRFRGLRDAVAAGDEARARHWGHAIKGGAAIAGGQRLAELAETIERAPDAQACAEARLRIDEMESVFDETRRALREWIDAQPSE
jgi:HPt (histidine-containing phosphotransfer) domain-containing protein